MLTIPDLTEIGIELSASVLVRSRVELPDDLSDLCRVAQRLAHSALSDLIPFGPIPNPTSDLSLLLYLSENP